MGKIENSVLLLLLRNMKISVKEDLRPYTRGLLIRTDTFSFGIKCFLNCYQHSVFLFNETKLPSDVGFMELSSI